jgi:hypothetical protein
VKSIFIHNINKETPYEKERKYSYIWWESGNPPG